MMLPKQLVPSCCLFFLACTLLPSVASDDIEGEDKQSYPAYNFGFHLGIEQSRLHLETGKNSRLLTESKLSGPGFHCGMLFNYSLGPKLAIQLLPNYVVGYNYLSLTGIDSLFTGTRKYDYFPFQVPVTLKYNFFPHTRSMPYLCGGLFINWDMANKLKRNEQEKPILLLNKLDYGTLVGFGIEQQMGKHTVSFEIKYFLGFNNLLNRHDPIIKEGDLLQAYTRNLAGIRAETFMISIKLE